MDAAEAELRVGLLHMLAAGYRIEVFADSADIVRPDGSIAFRISSDGTRSFEDFRTMARELANRPGVAIEFTAIVKT